MKKVYIKTKWIDDETPVNAANLNKLENAISDLYQSTIGPADLESGDGISIGLSEKTGKIKVSTTASVLKSSSIRAFELVEGVPEVSPRDTLLIVIDPATKKLRGLWINGVYIYEVEQ